MEFNASLLRKELEKPKCWDHFSLYHPGPLEFYERHMLRNGAFCPLVAAALKVLWAEELHRDYESFYTSLSSGEW